MQTSILSSVIYGNNGLKRFFLTNSSSSRSCEKMAGALFAWIAYIGVLTSCCILTTKTFDNGERKLNISFRKIMVKTTTYEQTNRANIKNIISRDR